MIRKVQKLSMITILSIMFVGCVEPKVDMPQHSEINKVNTDYSNTLDHLDQMVSVFRNGQPMTVVITAIEDRTASKGKVPKDITDIVKTSFNKIGNHVVTVFNNNGQKNRKNIFVINGAITEFDVVEARDGSIDSGLQIGGGRGQTEIDGRLRSGSKITQLALNFNPANPKTGTYIARTSTSNKITIYEKKRANEFAFSILGSGFGFSNAVTKTQGLHSSITVLVELSVAEVLGKLGKFPYWLLTNGKVDNDVIQYLSSTFLRNSLNQKIEKISYILSLMYRGVEPTSIMTSSLKRAIIHYKTAHGLEVNDFITKELYLSLLRG